jgi:hypothetical protein
MQIKKLFAATAALLAISPAFASDQFVDGVYAEYSSASKIKMVHIGVTKDWPSNWSWFNSNGTHLTGYWDAGIGFWQGDRYNNVQGDKQNIVDLGFTPVFRFEKTSKRGFYAEGGIGAHLLSKTYNNNDDHLSTAFQFGDHAGVGYVFDNKWEVGAKYQHYSNGGIKKPNSGVDVFVIKAAYKF